MYCVYLKSKGVLVLVEKKWTKRDFIGLTVIPIEFILGTIAGKLPLVKQSPLAATLISLVIFFTGFLVMIYLFRDFLKREWRDYKKNKLWLKLLLTVLLVIGAYAILMLVRATPIANLSVNDQDSLSTSGLALSLLASIQPFIAPFSEELTFRYLLFGKFTNKWLKGLMFFVSAILFGLIHINNFGGNWLLTIPYMFVGAYFSLIYLGYKNIWGSILVHWLFNSVNSVIPTLFLLIMKLLGIL